MTYTPINWQTGDTITAEKMNKMDNGWGVQNTQLFSETVTTEDADGVYIGMFIYNETIDASTITVTFDGTDYICQRIDMLDMYFYGGTTEQGPDFTDYPFCITSETNENSLYTETASTHTVVVSVPTIETSSNFDKAVQIASAPFYIEIGVTTWRQVSDALRAGRMVYFAKETNSLYALYTAESVSSSGYSVALVYNGATMILIATDADSPLQRSE